MATKLRSKDHVVVIAGKDKGKRGTILRVLRDGRAVVEGINLVKKHQKPVPSLNIVGAIVDKEAPIQMSNLALWNPATGKADRVGFRFEEDKKVRFFKSNNETVNIITLRY